MPTYRITAPDGRKFRVTGEGTKEEALAHIQAQVQSPAERDPSEYDPSSKAWQEKYGATSGMGFGDKLLAGAGKAVSDVGSGARQLSTQIGNAVGFGRLAPASFGDAEVERQRAETAESRRLDAPLMETGAGKVGNLAGNVAMAAPTAFIPGANSVTGAGLVGAGLGMAQPAVSGSERLLNTGLGGALGSAGQWVGGKVAGWVGNKLAERSAKAATEKAQNSARDQVLKEGLDAGYAVPPSTTNPTTTNAALESVAGKAATQGAASVKNQKVTNQLIREDLGIPESAPLTREALKAVRTEAGKAYQAIKNSGAILADQQFLDDVVDLVGGNPVVSKQFPGAKVSTEKDVVDLADSLLQDKFSAEGALEYAKRLRSQSKENFKSAYGSGGNPEKLQLAQAQWNAAGALEDAIERNLQSRGQGVLAEQFKQARTMIAKSYSAEAALNEGTGNIVASKLMQQLRKGKPLDGGFAQVAKFASAVPKAMAEPTQSTGVSALNAAMYGGGAMLGSPAVIAIPVARLLTKRAILSRTLQQRNALPKYTPSATSTALLRGTRGLGRIGGPLAASAYATEQ